jgi:5-oxoprolinase (ATP-hydrolysing)
MAQAVRKLAAQRGVDLRDHALVSYGGAAGQHAAAVAERLGIETVLVHPCASVLCAWGQSLSPREESRVAALWRPLEEAYDEAVQLMDTLESELPELGLVQRTLEIRHEGCDHAIEVEVGTDQDATVAAFEAAHRQRYGFDRGETNVEIVNVRVRVRSPVPERPLVEDDPWGLGDDAVAGPLRLDSATTSVVVPEGWSAARENGLLVLRSTGETEVALPGERTPLRRRALGQSLHERRL